MTSAAESLFSAFEARAERAELLAPASRAAQAPLLFAASLLRAQAACAKSLATLPLTGKLADDVDRLHKPFLELLRAIEKSAPPELAADARARGQSKDSLLPPLFALWSGDSADYLSRALLRPYTETLRELSLTPDKSRGPGCGFCGGPPWVAVRRTSVETEGADGAARFLCCALCGSEKPYPRIRCPGCGEQDPAKLPQYKSETYPEARIEACESCRRYLKSIDLTIDARPIAEVDELRSVAMDLWALEQGFVRLEPGIAGV